MSAISCAAWFSETKKWRLVSELDCRSDINSASCRLLGGGSHFKTLKKETFANSISTGIWGFCPPYLAYLSLSLALLSLSFLHLALSYFLVSLASASRLLLLSCLSKNEGDPPLFLTVLSPLYTPLSLRFFKFALSVSLITKRGFSQYRKRLRQSAAIIDPTVVRIDAYRYCMQWFRWYRYRSMRSLLRTEPKYSERLKWFWQDRCRPILHAAVTMISMQIDQFRFIVMIASTSGRIGDFRMWIDRIRCCQIRVTSLMNITSVIMQFEQAEVEYAPAIPPMSKWCTPISPWVAEAGW